MKDISFIWNMTRVFQNFLKSGGVEMEEKLDLN